MKTAFRCLALTALTVLSTLILDAQCGLDVVAGRDTTICPANLPFPVSGFAEGEGLFGVEWAPAGVFQNASSAETVFKGNRDTTVYFTAFTARPEDNLFQNPGFGDRFDNWETNYQFEPGGEWGPVTPPGSWSINRTPTAVHRQFCGLRDSDSNNRMMIANNSGRNNDPILCQTVTVEPMTEYVASGFLATVRDTNPSVVRWAVNRTGIGGDITLPETCDGWQQYTARWNSGAATTAQVCLVNRSEETIGTDLAIDELFFGPVCLQTDSFRITLPDLRIELDPEFSLPCMAPEEGVQLDASASTSGRNIQYRWTTTNGNIRSGADTPRPFVTEAGTYILELIYDAGNGSCSRTQSIEVVPDPFQPTVELSADGFLNCLVSEVEIDSRGSSDRAGFTYIWTPRRGIVDNDREEITVDEPGTYTLTIIGNRGCTASRSITIPADYAEPAISFVEPERLGCGVETVTIDASASDGGPDIDVSWNIFGPGRIIAGANTLTPTVDRRGTYELVLVNRVNGCERRQRIPVGRQLFQPDLAFNVPQPFTCDRAEIDVRATVTNLPFGEEIDYAWTTRDGGVVSGAAAPNVRIGRPGTYVLTVTNRENGCTASDSVRVEPGAGVPVAEAGTAPALTCDRASVTLDATGSSTDAAYVRTWTNGAGEEISDLTVTTAGLYRLTIVNPADNCSAFDTVRVMEDRTPPPVMIDAESTMLTCAVADLSLAASRENDAFAFAWSGPEGGIAGDATTAEITAGLPGTYTLRTTDTRNACFTEQSLDVTADRERPEITLAAPGDITCTEPTQILAGTIANPGGFELTWTTTGNIVSGADTPTPTIDAGGTYQLRYANPATGCADSLTVEVIENNAPVIAALSGGGELKCREPSVDLLTAGSSAGENIRYIWSLDGNEIADDPSLDGDVFAATEAGVYTLLVENTGSGCTATDEVTVLAARDAPEVIFARTQVLTCGERQRTLRPESPVEPAWTYAWSTDDGTLPPVTDTEQLDVTAPGRYVLDVSDPASGCVTSVAVTVEADTEAPAPVIAAPSALDCRNDNVLLDGSTSAVSRPVVYAWSTADGAFAGPADTDAVTATAPGTYQLRMTYPDNACADSVTVLVVADREVPEVVLEEPDVLDCRNPEITLTTRVDSRDPGYTYAWSLGGTPVAAPPSSATLEVDAPGTYALLVTDTLNGCTQSLTATVADDSDRPGVTLPGTALLTCTNPSATAVAMLADPDRTVTFAWTTGDGNILSGAATATVEAGAAGRYTLRVTDVGNGCTADAVWRVEANQAAPPLTVDPVVDLGCDTLPATLTASTDRLGYAFNWTTVNGTILSGADRAAVTVDGRGTYVLTVTDPTNGCITTAPVRVDQDIPERFAFTVMDPSCGESRGSLAVTGVTGGVGPYLYSFNGGATFEPSGGERAVDTGGYVIVVQDARGCELRENVRITPARDLLLDLPEIYTIAIGDSIQLSLAANYLPGEIDTIIWSGDAGLSCLDCPDPYARPFQSARYTVEVRARNGCTATALVTVEVDKRQNVYFPTAFSPNNDGRNDLFQPFGDARRVLQIRDFRVFDRWGNAVWETAAIRPNDIQAGWDGRYGGSRPANTGVYAYSAVVEFLGGEVVTVKGEVVLVR